MGSREVFVGVDPRIELIAAVQMLTRGAEVGISSSRTPYRKEVEAWFRPYRKHPAVSRCEKLIAGGFDRDAPVSLALHLSNPPKLKVVRALPRPLTERAGSVEELHEFVKILGDFAKASDFDGFWGEHKEFYDEVRENASRDLQVGQLAKGLEDYFGAKLRSYSAVLAPLLKESYAHQLPMRGGWDACLVLCPMGWIGPLPSFSHWTGAITQHFARVLMEPIIKAFERQIQGISALSQPIGESMKEMGYENWKVALKEHLVRVVHARLQATEIGPEQGVKATARQERRGFLYAGSIYDLLSYFEERRERFQDLKSFFPTVLNLLASLEDRIKAGKGPTLLFSQRFIGPTGAVFDDKRFSERVVHVKPTRFDDSRLAEKTEEDMGVIAKFAERLGVEINMISDDDALKLDLSEKVPVIYGTPRSNLLLSRWLERFPFPFKVEEGRITLGSEVFSGRDLRFITACPNPENLNLPTLIYTGTTDEAVIGISTLLHGPTDFILYEGNKKVFEGTYTKDRGRWEPPPD